MGRLREAIETSLATGCTDASAVEHLFAARDLNRVACEPVEVGMLERYQRPMPLMNEYDRLLIAGVAQ